VPQRRCSYLAANAQQNLSSRRRRLGRAAAWSAQRIDEVADIGEIAVDGAVAAGARSLRISSAAAMTVRVGQAAAVAVIGQPRWRAAFVSCRRGAPARGSEAALWLRISGTKGVLFVDSRGDGRERRLADVAIERSAAGSDEASAEWVRRELELPLPDDAQEITFGAVLRGVGTAWFDDFAISVVPAGGAAPSAAAVRYLDAALGVMELHSLNRTAVDWAALRRVTLGQAHGGLLQADHPAPLRAAERRYRLRRNGNSRRTRCRFHYGGFRHIARKNARRTMASSGIMVRVPRGSGLRGRHAVGSGAVRRRASIRH
jgi:hypothetical protein